MIHDDSIKAKASAKVLVTGAGGFLGGAIVKQLVDRGDDVRSFSRNYYPELAQLGVEQILGDIVDNTAVEAACKGVGTRKGVYHTTCCMPSRSLLPAPFINLTAFITLCTGSVEPLLCTVVSESGHEKSCQPITRTHSRRQFPAESSQRF